ncbi:toll/interleukin-1 receptor domain-containing protein [Mucilaginibacter sp. Mucisp86]|uniref:toll/interleukin-1 receptor domain-containing protein n=1 Tax=Mucilaginibacter sp. Mucisp86 TaxID=3243060 RepID=UPI0039B507AC
MAQMKNAVKIFISYASQDKNYLLDIKKWLRYAQHENITIWDDGELGLAKSWDQTIKARLNEADIVLFLISIDFLSSRYIQEIELKQALDRHRAGKCYLVPVFVRHCILDELDEVMVFQGFPKGTFFSDLTHELDRYYTEFQRKITALIGEVRINNFGIVGEDHEVSGQGLEQKEQAITIREQENYQKKILLAPVKSHIALMLADALASQIEREKKYQSWEFTLIQPFDEAKFEEEMANSLYTVHIFTSQNEINDGAERGMFDFAFKNTQNSEFKSSLIWLSSPDLEDKLPAEMKACTIIKGLPSDLTDNIKVNEIKRQEIIDNKKKIFLPKLSVFMMYDFEKDHGSPIRIKLKRELEGRGEILSDFAPPNYTNDVIENYLNISEGVIIFYGNSTINWYCHWQDQIQKMFSRCSRAVYIDNPDKIDKLERDVNNKAFLVMQEEGLIRQYVDQFITNLKNSSNCHGI